MKGNAGQAQPQDMALAQGQFRTQGCKDLGNHGGGGRRPIQGQQQGTTGDPGDAPAQPWQGFDPDLRCGNQLPLTFQHQTAHFAADPGGGRAAIRQALLKTQIAELPRICGPLSLGNFAHQKRGLGHETGSFPVR